ncbi:hypothetical protein [Actinomadura sp. CNU-125]|nr:hypothetical protein [Actinomadura sp. CNU-125]
MLGWALTTSLGWRTAFLLAVPPTFAALLLAVAGGIVAVGARSAPRRVT